MEGGGSGIVIYEGLAIIEPSTLHGVQPPRRVHPGAGDCGQLQHPAPHVRALGMTRRAPAGERVARAVGAVVVGAGLFLIARATGLG